MKELVPIVLACAFWRHAWQWITVFAQCDNMAVVVVSVVDHGTMSHI